MLGHAAMEFTQTAAVSSAGGLLSAYVTPVVHTLGILAALVCVLFLIIGGFHYMTSRGQVERLEHAKKVIRNALLGLVLVLAATALTALLSQAYSGSSSAGISRLPTLNAITPAATSGGLIDILINAITGLLNNIVQSSATPFIKALSYFTSGTPLIASNASVFTLWLAVLGMADALFVLVVALLGFHVMSYASLGLNELEFKHLLPQLGLTFLLMNSSVFLIDSVIGLSNAMVHAIAAGFAPSSVWNVLSGVAEQASGFGLAALLIMLAFLIFAVILLIYYVGRLVTIYIGAVLAPLVLLLGLLPGFRDFALNAAKTYFATIFVLFVHVVILALAASLFTGLSSGPTHSPDPLMAMIVGLAALIALLKTQGVMMQLSYASIGPRTARKLGGQFITGVSYMSGQGRSSASPSSPGSAPRGRAPIMASSAPLKRPMSLGSSGSLTPAPKKAAAASVQAPTGLKVTTGAAKVPMPSSLKLAAAKSQKAGAGS